MFRAKSILTSLAFASLAATTLLSSSAAEDKEINLLPTILTTENFSQRTAENDFLILFFAPECELSKKFLPTFSKLAEQFNAKSSGLKFAGVNCDNEKDLCKEKGIQSLEVHLYKKDEGHVKFSGVKNTEGLAKFLVKHLGDHVLDDIIEMPEKIEAINELTEDTFTDHIAVGQHFIKFYAPWCGHCQRLAPTWDELASALEYDDSVSVSKIDCTKFRPICQDFDVKGYPTLLWIVDGKKVEKYTGARSLDDLKKYVENTAGIKKAQESNDIEKVHDTEEDGVLHLNGDSFQHGIEKGVTLVKFFAPWCGYCKRMATTWDELATKFIGNTMVKIAKVDCTVSDNKELCSEQEVSGFPTIYIYKNGVKQSEYLGSRSFDDLYEFVIRHTGHDEL